MAAGPAPRCGSVGNVQGGGIGDGHGTGGTHGRLGHLNVVVACGGGNVGITADGLGGSRGTGLDIPLRLLKPCWWLDPA